MMITHWNYDISPIFLLFTGVGFVVDKLALGQVFSE
jgi:hypothetical protein